MITLGEMTLTPLGVLLITLFIFVLAISISMIVNSYMSNKNNIEKRIKVMNLGYGDKLLIEISLSDMSLQEAQNFKNKVSSWLGISPKNILIVNDSLKVKMIEIKEDQKCQCIKEMK